MTDIAKADEGLIEALVAFFWPIVAGWLDDGMSWADVSIRLDSILAKQGEKRAAMFSEPQRLDMLGRLRGHVNPAVKAKLALFFNQPKPEDN